MIRPQRENCGRHADEVELTKLLNIFGAMALATVLAGGGFIGYLFGTGHLNAARVEQLAGVLRGQYDEPAPTSAPASQPTSAPATGGVCTQEELKALRQRKHLEMLEAERAARDLEAQRRLLDQVLQQVVQEQERLAAAEKQTTEQQKKASAAPDADQGLQKEVALVAGLPAKQAKEHLLRVWQKQPADAVRLLNGLSPGIAKKVLEQFKTPEEIQIRTDLLEQIRLQSRETSARSAGTTGGAAAP